MVIKSEFARCDRDTGSDSAMPWRPKSEEIRAAASGASRGSLTAGKEATNGR